jgi:hypothetical protein
LWKALGAPHEEVRKDYPPMKEKKDMGNYTNENNETRLGITLASKWLWRALHFFPLPAWAIEMKKIVL